MVCLLLGLKVNLSSLNLFNSGFHLMLFYIKVFTSRFTTTMFKFLFKKKKVCLSIPVFVCVCEALTAFIVTAGFGFWLVSAGRVVTVPAIHCLYQSIHK